MKYKGFCFTKDGQKMPHADLENEEDAARYLRFQSQIFHRVIIVDRRDVIVGEVKDGKLIKE